MRREINLKVVGASARQTLIGTLILVGAGLLVILVFVISLMDREPSSGNYCATAVWSGKFGFKIEYLKQRNNASSVPKDAARICFRDTISENGWAQLEIETTRTKPDWVQAFSAGMLEGSLTWMNIYQHWDNTIQSSCQRDQKSTEFCEWLREVLVANFKYLRERAKERGGYDHYWHQIDMFCRQLEGLVAGYEIGAERARSDLENELPLSEFLLLNAAADIQDLRIYYENFVIGSNSDQAPKNFNLPNAAMLTRILPVKGLNSSQLLFGHSTAGSYTSMIRIHKRYIFHFHFTNDKYSHSVPGVDITFSGYPGILGSTDDFYFIKGRQLESIVGGVPTQNENFELWKTLELDKMVPLVARVMAANRISQNRRTWAKAVGRDPYTGSKQWITVDIRKLGVQDRLYIELDRDEKHDDAAVQISDADMTAIYARHDRNKDMVWIAEQLPGHFRSLDVTEKFLQAGNSTWLANGVPYIEDMLQLSGLSRDNYSPDLSPAEEAELTSLEAIDKYMRTHGFRGDLLGDAAIPYGHIDIKLFSYDAKIEKSDYHAYAGPIFLRLEHSASYHTDQSDIVASTEQDSEELDMESSTMPQDMQMDMQQIPERRPPRNDLHVLTMGKADPFKWSDLPEKTAEDATHRGQPDEWNFEKYSPLWIFS